MLKTNEDSFKKSYLRWLRMHFVAYICCFSIGVILLTYYVMAMMHDIDIIALNAISVIFGILLILASIGSMINYFKAPNAFFVKGDQVHILKYNRRIAIDFEDVQGIIYGTMSAYMAENVELNGFAKLNMKHMICFHKSGADVSEYPSSTLSSIIILNNGQVIKGHFPSVLISEKNNKKIDNFKSTDIKDIDVGRKIK